MNIIELENKRLELAHNGPQMCCKCTNSTNTSYFIVDDKPICVECLFEHPDRNLALIAAYTHGYSRGLSRGLREKAQ
jgi:hypothetical protein